MTAFRLAWSEGADGIELDIQRTRDGEIVVFHDLTGARLTGDHRAVAELPWCEIAGWDVGIGKNVIYQGTHVPRLLDVMLEAPRNHLILIEVKSGPEILSDLQHLLAKFPHADCALLTFDLPLGLQAVKLLPHIPVYLNVEAENACEIDGVLTGIQRGGLHGISLGWSELVNESLVKKIHHAGMPLAVWTLNTKEDALLARDLGVDLLMTDHPEVMAALVKHA